MDELEQRCLEMFPSWLRTLGDDARALSQVVSHDELPEGARRQIAATLNYLFRSLDLIPDGIEGLGFVDDAFVLRVGAERALSSAGEGLDGDEVLPRLARDVALIREFLGPLYERLDAYVGTLERVVARGRTVEQILVDDAVRDEFTSELRGFADSYVPPGLARDAKSLVKLRSFLATKLGG
jgi:uncharacterized membrane protein YkvA (DUF1232 family)